MNDAVPPRPDRVPTLTEVVVWDDVAEPHETAAHPSTLAQVTAATTPAASAPTPPPIDETTLIADVMAALARQIDLDFDARLRATIAPALARAADGLMREIEPELTRALRDLAVNAVAGELARRDRGDG